MLADTISAFQVLVNKTIEEANRTRSQKLLAACRELDVVLDEVAKGETTEEIFKDKVQAVVLAAGLVDASTELDLIPAAKAVVLAMRPYEALLRLEHDARTARTVPNAGDPEATRKALYAAIEGLSLPMLKEYGEYRKGAAK